MIELTDFKFQDEIILFSEEEERTDNELTTLTKSNTISDQQNLNTQPSYSPIITGQRNTAKQEIAESVTIQRKVIIFVASNLNNTFLLVTGSLVSTITETFYQKY